MVKIEREMELAMDFQNLIHVSHINADSSARALTKLSMVQEVQEWKMNGVGS